MNQDSHNICCCQEVSDVVQTADLDTLLARMFIYGYYNGPISGVIQCARCQSVYYFFTLDWSRDQCTRIIALAPIPQHSLQELVDFYSEQPRWPMWVPQMMREPSDAQREGMADRMRTIIQKAAQAEILLAWNVWTNRVFAARRLHALDEPNLRDFFEYHTADPLVDWFADLRLDRVRAGFFV